MHNSNSFDVENPQHAAVDFPQQHAEENPQHNAVGNQNGWQMRMTLANRFLAFLKTLISVVGLLRGLLSGIQFCMNLLCSLCEPLHHWVEERNIPESVNRACNVTNSIHTFLSAMIQAVQQVIRLLPYSTSPHDSQA